MCDCHAQMDAKLEPLNGKLAVGFQITDMSMPVMLLMHVEKINPRGKKPPLVLPSFCPFCGEKIKRESA
jgi:hypothetical protein